MIPTMKLGAIRSQPSAVLWAMTLIVTGALTARFNSQSARIRSMYELQEFGASSITLYQQKILLAVAFAIGTALVIQAVLLMRQWRTRLTRWHFGKLIILWPVSAVIAFGWWSLGAEIFPDDPVTLLGAVWIGIVLGMIGIAAVVPIVATWIWLGGKERESPA